MPTVRFKIRAITLCLVLLIVGRKIIDSFTIEAKCNEPKLQKQSTKFLQMMLTHTPS